MGQLLESKTCWWRCCSVACQTEFSCIGRSLTNVSLILKHLLIIHGSSVCQWTLLQLQRTFNFQNFVKKKTDYSQPEYLIFLVSFKHGFIKILQMCVLKKFPFRLFGCLSGSTVRVTTSQPYCSTTWYFWYILAG